jgi:hypothetical protein
MTVTPAVQPAAGTTVSVAGFITVDIGGTKYTLEGTVGSSIVVAYHRPFADAANVGTIASIIGDVGTALGSTNLAANVNNALDELKPVPLLGPVVNAIATANIRITDLAINTATKTYQFGFGLDFTQEVPPIQVGSIALDSFGLVVTAQG